MDYVNRVPKVARHVPRLMSASVAKLVNHSHLPPILLIQVNTKQYALINAQSD